MERVCEWAENNPGINSLELEMQQEIANFIAEMFMGSSSTIKTPQTLTEARASSEWPKWEEAMKTELEQLQKMQTWKLVNLPTGRKPMGCCWVFSVKLNKNGDPAHFKARLVAKGYSQILGQDFDQMFAPVMQLDSLQNLITIASIHDLDMNVLDVKSVYLHGDLEETIYMKQPVGFDDGMS